MNHKQKQEVITFKADPVLAAEIKKLPNRSDFIRRAILAAMENTCPLCQGTGIITPEQKPHWEEFLKHHSLHKCEDCEAIFLKCQIDGSASD